MSALARRSALIAATLLIPILIFALRYEYAERDRDRIWRAGFDNFGWLGRLTVASDNPILLWEYKPNTLYAQKGGVIRTNRHGFRDDLSVEMIKPDGVHRIAFLGASVTLGMFVPVGRTYVKRFQAIARKRFPNIPVEALNFGVDGYSTVQVAELLRSRVLGFAPDSVDYMLTLASFDFTDASGGKKRYFDPPQIFLFDALAGAVRRFERRRRSYFEYHFDRNRDGVFDEIRRMKNELAERNVRFRVTLLPPFPKEEDGFDPYPYGAIHDEINAFLEEEGITHLDLLELLRQQQVPPRDLGLDIWHPNPRGHTLIAQALLAAHAPDWKEVRATRAD